jgi:hypothetical protein
MHVTFPVGRAPKPGSKITAEELGLRSGDEVRLYIYLSGPTERTGPWTKASFWLDVARATAPNAGLMGRAYESTLNDERRMILSKRFAETWPWNACARDGKQLSFALLARTVFEPSVAARMALGEISLDWLGGRATDDGGLFYDYDKTRYHSKSDRQAGGKW